MDFVFPPASKNTAATLCHADATEVTSRHPVGMSPSEASSPSMCSNDVPSVSSRKQNPQLHHTPGTLASYSSSHGFLTSAASATLPSPEHAGGKFVNVSEPSPLARNATSPLGDQDGFSADEFDERPEVQPMRGNGRMKCKASTNLYISNIADDIDDAALEQAFAMFGHVQSSKVMLNIHTGKSRGIGFVKFDTVESAYSALVAMHRYPLRGQKIAVRFADARADFRPLEKSPKLFVRNIPLGLSLAELRAHFSQFGHLKHCTMHLDSAGFKAGGAGVRSRMAYVIYETVQEAEAALNAIHGTQPFAGAGDAMLMAKFAENEGQRNARRQQNKLDALASRRDAESHDNKAARQTSTEPSARPSAAHYGQPLPHQSTYGPIPQSASSYAPIAQGRTHATQLLQAPLNQRPPAYDAGVQSPQQQQAAAAAALAAAAAAAANPLLAHPALAYYSSLMAPFYAAQYGMMPGAQNYAQTYGHGWSQHPQSSHSPCDPMSPAEQGTRMHQTRSG